MYQSKKTLTKHSSLKIKKGPNTKSRRIFLLKKSHQALYLSDQEDRKLGDLRPTENKAEYSFVVPLSIETVFIAGDLQTIYTNVLYDSALIFREFMPRPATYIKRGSILYLG